MTELIPLEVLFGNPQRVAPAISPDGTQLAWIAPHDGVLNVWVAPVDTGQDGKGSWEAARVVTADADRGIRVFGWAEDSRHLLYLQDTGGDENWHLHDVDLETGAHRDLTPFDNIQARILATEPAFPTDVLVELNRDNPQLHDVYRLDLTTGDLVKEVENPGLVGWVADANLAVRAGLAPHEDGSLELMVRDTADGDWRSLLTFPADDAATSGDATFTADGGSLIALSSLDADTGRLVRLNLATGASEVLAADPEADVTGVRLHPHTREPQIVTVLKDRSEYLVLNPSLEPDLAAIRALHPGDPVFSGGDDSDTIWLISFTNDVGSIAYFAYDRSTRTGRLLFEARPELSRYELAAMEPFSFTARDGLTIHGYATFPPGVERSRLPMVLNVHGGPWTRDVWGYTPEAQWLANRGYLCVQVNYRGSTGYGKAFINAGDKEFGGTMQDDLTDAVGFAIGEGWAAPERVAIYGGSYGGYAALAGAAFTPDLYCCAVDIVGPSNLKTLIESIPPYWAPMLAMFHRRVGNPATDEALLWARSPLSRASDIRIPMLIAQGANDPRVKQAESEQIVAAMREAGIDHDYMLFPDEGHGFAKPENRLRFYAAADRFLAKHLGGRAAEEQDG
jgi:dipeptidyl aminopeptidase/acylaminoacyl peptidase